MEAAVLDTWKRDHWSETPREDESPDLGEPTYAAKKKVKPAIPTEFPDPHTYMGSVRQPWEGVFEGSSSQIRLKPNWQEKIHTNQIVANWESEIKEPGHHSYWPT